MKYIKLGKSELLVSRICLGCMSFGDNTKDRAWVLDQEQTDKIVKLALDNGINFFDTANCYSEGTSEIYLGNALRKSVKREDVIIATKVYFNEGHLSYEAILREVDKSLERLGTNYIDLLIIHRFDYSTPIEETMRALNEVVKQGKVRYLGASAMFAYQFTLMQECARKNHWAEFVSMQNHYSLIYREEEREMNQLLLEEGVSSTPYSPLGGGRLARPVGESTYRMETDIISKQKYDHAQENDNEIINRVSEIANKYQISQSKVALAWLLEKEVVASPIIGVTKEKHLIDAIEALEVKLEKEDVKYLEELYRPHVVVGALKK